MQSQTIVNSYSEAMIRLAKEKRIIEKVRNAATELIPILKLKEVQDFFDHPRIPLKARREVLTRFITTEIPVGFRNFLNLIFDRHRENLLLAIVERVRELSLTIKGYEIVELISACHLTNVRKDGIKKRLEEIWQTKVFLKYRQNPALIAGIIIRRGDLMIDGSLTGQLNDLKATMLEEVSVPHIDS